MSFVRRPVPFTSSLMVPFLLASAASMGAVACSAGVEDGGTSSNTTTNTGGDGGSAGGMTTGGAGGEGNAINLGGGGSGGGEIVECVAESVDTELLTLDMVILLDRSGSMSGSSWNDSVAALANFVTDPNSVGVNAGITYFPLSSATSACDPDDYDELTVPVGPIGMGGLNTQVIVDSMDFENPGGLTPMFGALEGVLFHATALQDLNPDHKVVVVLASDGSPNDCPDNSIAGISALAASALNYNGVQTFTIAITGADLGALNTIAAAGGTGQAFDVTANTTQFAEKMKEIREASLSCEYIIPEPPRGEELDPDLVNLTYAPGDGGAEVTFTRADGPADCGGGLSWYYDDANNPEMILLCPSACNLVQADGQAAVTVAFGCVTDVN